MRTFCNLQNYLHNFCHTKKIQFVFPAKNIIPILTELMLYFWAEIMAIIFFTHTTFN